jgi:hypothetical protein
MKREAQIDISDNPELLQLAEAVRKAGKPTVLRRGSESIAVLSPIEQVGASRKRAPQRSMMASPNAWLDSLVGIARSEDRANVSANVDKYLADAAYAESHPAKES